MSIIAEDMMSILSPTFTSKSKANSAPIDIEPFLKFLTFPLTNLFLDIKFDK